MAKALAALAAKVAQLLLLPMGATYHVAARAVRSPTPPCFEALGYLNLGFGLGLGELDSRISESLVLGLESRCSCYSNLGTTQVAVPATSAVRPRIIQECPRHKLALSAGQEHNRTVVGGLWARLRDAAERAMQGIGAVIRSATRPTRSHHRAQLLPWDRSPAMLRVSFRPPFQRQRDQSKGSAPTCAQAGSDSRPISGGPWSLGRGPARRNEHRRELPGDHRGSGHG